MAKTAKDVEARQLESELIQYRRRLHEHPELSNEEFETTKSIRRWLADAGINVLDFPLKTGVLAEIKGKKEGPTVALRADIDALPILEETHLPFASKVPGKMHACGHDFHTSAILGAARLLKEQEDAIEGTVKIIFQPAEESGGGAERVVQTGVLDDVQAIFGMHNKPDLPVGTIGITDGPLMAGVDRFEIEIKGVGTHAAAPEKGIDPIVVSAHVITALQTIVSRNISPLDNAVISVTHLEAGNTWNVIPGKAVLEGTIRTFQESVRAAVPGAIRRVIDGVAQALGATATLRLTPGPPPVKNDRRLTEWTAEVAEKSGFNVVDPVPSAAGEDFAEYQKIIPGTFVFMGTSGTEEWHHPAFTLDESALLPSAGFFSALAIDALKRLKES